MLLIWSISSPPVKIEKDNREVCKHRVNMLKLQYTVVFCPQVYEDKQYTGKKVCWIYIKYGHDLHTLKSRFTNINIAENEISYIGEA